jgi:alkylation response protein AidB-like acyl-CoA dehydrogenase
LSAARARDRALFAATVVANLLLLYWPRAVGAGGVPHLDKVVHLVAFAAVAWTGLRAGLPARWLGALLGVHAVTSETVQAWLLPGRSGDPADALADLGGVVLGLIGGSWRHDRARAQRGADRPAARRDPGPG